MNQPKRKFLSEFSVSLFTSQWLAVTADQLATEGVMPETEKTIAERCHIYLICRRPSFCFDPNTFKFDKGHVTGHLTYKISGRERRLPFRLEFPLLDGGKDIRLTPYPHREFQTIDDKGDVVRYVPAYMVFGALEAKGEFQVSKKLKGLEVIYVGQAYADGKRNAFDRLKSHSTMQKILATAHYNAPDDQIWVLTFVYEPHRILLLFDGRSETAIRGAEDEARFVSIKENPLSQHEEICLAEAGLIRYFQPKYNKIYKESFPCSDLEILKACYDRDFSGLSVEIDTEEIGWPLYSESVSPSTHHIAICDLHDPGERLSFFALDASSQIPGVVGPTR